MNFDLAQQMKQLMEKLGSVFKTHHYELVDVIQGNEALQKEKDILNELDDGLAILAAHVQQLIIDCAYLFLSNPHKIASKKLLRIQRCLSSVNKTIASFTVSVSFISLSNSCQTSKENLGPFAANCYSRILRKQMDLVLCK